MVVRYVGVSLLGALAAAVLGAGCAAEPQQVQRAGTIGTNAQVGQMLIRNVHVDAPEKGLYLPGDNAVVRFELYNQADQPDALIGAGSRDAAAVRLRWDRNCDGTAETVAGIPVQAEATVPGPPPSADASPAYRLEVVQLTDVVRPGTTLPVTFTFERAGERTVDAMVQVPGDNVLPPPVCPAGDP